jgi:carbon monoxide dehydrogenase subunit G
MAHRIEQTLTVSIPAQKVWQVLSDYSGVEKFAPTVKSSPIVGDKKSGIQHG